MTIDRETLLAQRAQLEAERDDAVARVNAILGAIQLLDRLLAQLQEPEPPQEPKVET